MAVAERYDVVVVGSGAAGSFAARELSEHGLSVLVLEAGRDVTPDELRPKKGEVSRGPNLVGRIRAVLSGQPLQARVAFFNPTMARFLVNDLVHRYRTARKAPYLWFRGRQVGGRLHIFGRVLFRWSDHDFKPLPGSGRVAWPIEYADLAPWYAKAETVLGVHGNMDDADAAPDGVMAGPAPLTRSESTFVSKVQARWPQRKVIAWRFVPPDGEPVPRALADALATKCTTLRSNAVVTQVLTDPQTGLATGVRFRDRVTCEAFEVRASAVVLCASPVETVRLLLASRSAFHPQGLGNSSGTLGRYFMDQPASLVLARFSGQGGEAAPDMANSSMYGSVGGVYIPRHLPESDVADPARLPCSFQGGIGRYPHVDPGPTDDASFMGYGEMLPHSDNTITLDRKRKDRWGVPLPIITCRLHKAERTALSRQVGDMVEMIEAAGGSVCGSVTELGIEEHGEGLYRDLNPVSRWIVRRMLPRSLTIGAAIHESGGARMGATRQDSILNSWNQVWDAPNVLVTDASAFPSSGVMGTTLTVMAMTMRACAHLALQLRSGPMHGSD